MYLTTLVQLLHTLHVEADLKAVYDAVSIASMHIEADLTAVIQDHNYTVLHVAT